MSAVDARTVTVKHNILCRYVNLYYAFRCELCILVAYNCCEGTGSAQVPYIPRSLVRHLALQFLTNTLYYLKSKVRIFFQKYPTVVFNFFAMTYVE